MISDVTTIITSFNKGPYLAEAIGSALAQDYDHQVLVIDDGSTDNTRQVCESFAGRIQYIYQQNQGQACAKNHAIDLAQGEYVAFLDGDDRWRPGKLVRQMELLRSHPEIAVVFSRARVFHHLTGETWASHGNGNGPARGRILDQLFANNFIPFSSTVVRRQCLLDIGKFDSRLRVNDDYELWLRMAQQYAFDFVDEELLEYRVGIDQIGSRFPDQLSPAVTIIDNFIGNFYEGHYPRPEMVRKSLGARYKAHGDSLLSHNRNRDAMWAHLQAMRHNPWDIDVYARVLRDTIPNKWAGRLKRLVGRA